MMKYKTGRDNPYIKNTTSLRECLEELAKHRERYMVRTTPVLYLFMGEQEWMSASEMIKLIRMKEERRGRMSIDFDAFIDWGSEEEESLCKIFLFYQGEAYAAFEIKTEKE